MKTRPQIATEEPTSRQWAMIRDDTERRFLSVAEVARYCGMADVEVLTWIDAGDLKASPVSIGRYRVAVGDLIAFLGKHSVEM